MHDREMQREIRDATLSDAPVILEIQKLAFYGQGVLYQDFTLAPLVQTLGELEEDFKKHAFLKALDAGKIVGSVRGHQEGDTCFITRLFVHPDHQNRGIGKMLMRAIEHKFGEAQRYELFTGYKSERNLALYAKLGYREFGQSKQDSGVTLVCLEKRKV